MREFLSRAVVSVVAVDLKGSLSIIFRTCHVKEISDLFFDRPVGGLYPF